MLTALPAALRATACRQSRAARRRRRAAADRAPSRHRLTRSKMSCHAAVAALIAIADQLLSKSNCRRWVSPRRAACRRVAFVRPSRRHGVTGPFDRNISVAPSEAAERYDGDGKVFFDQAAEENPDRPAKHRFKIWPRRGLGFTNVGMLNAKRD
jgi:hypothetical protein